MATTIPQKVEIIEALRNEDLYYDIYRDDCFVIGSQDAATASRRLEALQKNKWKWLCMKGHANPEPPEKFIAGVRGKDWHFDPIRLEIGRDGRAFLAGNVREYSAAFSYLLLCPDLIGRIMANVPDIELRDMRVQSITKIAA